MKILVVLCFFLAIYMVFKRSLGFSRFFSAYRKQLPLLYDERAYGAILDHFKLLVWKISFWLCIASLCVIILAFGI